MAGVQGTVAPGWEQCRTVFERRYEAGKEELGATFAVYHEGRQVVSLWCGWKDDDQEVPYTSDTLANVFSTTKGMAALSMAVLVDQGRISYDDKVVKYWPEFAAHGKEGCTVGDLCCHRAGLPACREDVSIRDYLAAGRIAEGLASQEPYWAPGTKCGYHAQTLGFLMGELIRRVTGQTIGRFFAEHVGRPHGIDFHIGLPAEDEGRVAHMGFFLPDEPAEAEGGGDAGGGGGAIGGGGLGAFVQSELQRRCFEPNPFGVINLRDWRAAEVASVNGQSNAAALARIYGGLANGGRLDGKTILSPAVLKRATTVREPGAVDVVLETPMEWRQGGFSGNPPEFPAFGKHPESFGHHGFGGQVAFADPVANLGFGFVRNGLEVKMHSLHHQDLVDAMYECAAAAAAAAPGASGKARL